jgi:hypothetical protein
MRSISPADVADPGLVRLGAGMKAPVAATTPKPALIAPAAVADPGLVRLGAGMRRGGMPAGLGLCVSQP